MRLWPPTRADGVKRLPHGHAIAVKQAGLMTGLRPKPGDSSNGQHVNDLLVIVVIPLTGMAIRASSVLGPRTDSDTARDNGIHFA